jgi:hypothetical protein
MPTTRLARTPLLAAAIAAGLVAAQAAPACARDSGPIARASGGDAPPVIPGIVRTRIKRAKRTLNRLGDYVDDGDAARVASAGQTLRRRVSASWRGARYYIKHAPPPAGDDESAVAKASGDGGGAPLKADAPTVAVAAFQLQDDVVSDIVELTDGAAAPVLSALTQPLFSTLDVRDKAVEDVHKLAPPAPDDDSLELVARASGDGGGSTFDTAMPQVALMLEDEMQQIDEMRDDGAELLPAGVQMLRDAELRILLTKRRVDSYWPPVPTED